MGLITVDKKIPSCCAIRLCCFGYGCRNLPSWSDTALLSGQFLCTKNLIDCGCIDSGSLPLKLKVFCLDCNTNSPGCSLDKSFPQCCAVVVCCFSFQTLQPCFFFGDDNWEHICYTNCLCLWFTCLKPAMSCQLCCLSAGTPVKTQGKGWFSVGAPPAEVEMVR